MGTVLSRNKAIPTETQLEPIQNETRTECTTAAHIQTHTKHPCTLYIYIDIDIDILVCTIHLATGFTDLDRIIQVKKERNFTAQLRPKHIFSRDAFHSFHFELYFRSLLFVRFVVCSTRNML